MSLFSASRLPIKRLCAVSLAALVGFTAYTPVAHAFNFGDMMNPNRWMGGNRYNNDYYDDEGLYGGPWGGSYGGDTWGAPYGIAPYGYGYPGVGLGAPGYYGAPGLTAPGLPSIPAAAAPSNVGSQAEVDALKRRIEELESAQRSAPTTPSPDRQPVPVFRPMDKY